MDIIRRKLRLVTSGTPGLFTKRERYPCARVTLASGLKLALVYKQISQVTLSPGSNLPVLLTCFVMRDIQCNVLDLK